MTLLKMLRTGQITLPAELRKQFNLVGEEYLEAEVTTAGILLKPVRLSERQQAGKALVQLLNRVHAQPPASDLSAEEQEELIAKEVKASREEKQRRHA
jgi:AbrB family looped-hinge helix DNA binding protein